MIAALHALQSPEQTVESFAPYEDSSVSPDARILSVKPVLVRRHDVVVLTLIFFLVKDILVKPLIYQILA